MRYIDSRFYKRHYRWQYGETAIDRIMFALETLREHNDYHILSDSGFICNECACNMSMISIMRMMKKKYWQIVSEDEIANCIADATCDNCTMPIITTGRDDD